MLSYAPTVIGAAGSLIFAVLFLQLLRRNHSTGSSIQWDESWFEDFSSFRYLPMRRLLADNDEDFIRTRADGTLLEIIRFRSERRKLFRGYLKNLKTDFQRLSMGARLAILHAPQDESHQVSRLIGLEWQFRKSVMHAEMRLALHALGVRPMDVTPLINALQHFEFALREAMLPAAA